MLASSRNNLGGVIKLLEPIVSPYYTIEFNQQSVCVCVDFYPCHEWGKVLMLDPQTPILSCLKMLALMNLSSKLKLRLGTYKPVLQPFTQSCYTFPHDSK